MLRRKLLREFGRQKAQVFAVTLVVFLGIALFVSSYAGYLDLSGSYEATQERLALADLHVDAAGVTAGHETAARAIPGVATAERRLVASLPLRVESRREGAADPTFRVEARFIGLPDEGEPALDRLLIERGGWPAAPDEILVEKHFADYHALRPGDVLHVRTAGDGEPLRVAGVAVSAEYLWVAKNRQEIMTSPRDFGVFWARRAELGRLCRAALAAWGVAMLRGEGESGGAPPGLAGALGLGEGDGNQLLVALAPGADEARVAASVRELFGDGFIRSTPRAELVGPQLLRMDLEGLQGMAFFFPAFFLAVGAFVVATLLGRLVDSQRRVIGTMLALGATRRAVLRHYLGFSVAIGAVGSVLGAAAGIGMGRMLVTVYAAELHIPYVLTRFHADVTLIGVAIGVAITALAGWLPARRAAALEPAAAMRRAPTAGRRSGALGRGLGRHLPFPLRLALRNAIRRPGRSLATALGVSAAVLLVLVTGVFLDSMEHGVDVTLRSTRFDFLAVLYSMEDADELAAQARAAPGAREVEVGLTVPVQLIAAGGRYETLAQGIPDDPRLFRPVDFDGRTVPIRPGEVVLPRTVSERIGVAQGATVTVRVLPGGPQFPARVGEPMDMISGSVAVLRRADLQARLGVGNGANTVLVAAPPAARPAVREALQKLPSLAGFQDMDALRESIDEMVDLGLAMIGMMLLLGVVLAAALLFNTATLSILERQRELATQRALGQSTRTIALTMTLENGLLALLGLAVGVPVGLLAGEWLVSYYSTDLLCLPFAVSGRTLGIAVLGVLLVLLVAQWPGLRSIGRMNVAEAVRGDDD